MTPRVWQKRSKSCSDLVSILSLLLLRHNAALSDLHEDAARKGMQPSESVLQCLVRRKKHLDSISSSAFIISSVLRRNKVLWAQAQRRIRQGLFLLLSLPNI